MIQLWSEITSGSIQFVKGHICFTKSFLLKMSCRMSSWRFSFFYMDFYCLIWKSIGISFEDYWCSKEKCSQGFSKKVCGTVTMSCNWHKIDILN